MKIAYVSDSCGRPIHPRGIFNYSANLIKALHAQGHNIDLVTAWAPTRANHKIFDTQAGNPDLIKTALIVSYLCGYTPIRKRRFLRKLRNKSHAAVKVSLGASTTWAPHDRVVNNCEHLDFIPSGYDFLHCISDFVAFNHLYDLQNATAEFGFPALRLDLRGYDCVVFDTPHHLKITTNKEAKVVGIVHDIIPFTDPALTYYPRRIYANKYRATIDALKDVIFVSRTTQATHNRHFTTTAREHILHPVFTPDLRYCDTQGQPSDSATKTVVAVVSDEPRKNLQKLIDAFSLLPGNFKLHIIGQILPKNYKIPGSVQSRIVFEGWIPESAKLMLLAQADLSVFVSLAEGFGIPIVEGLFYTRRMVCSDLPVFREIVDESATFVDPLDPYSIARGIAFAVTRPKIAQAAAHALVQRFTAHGQRDAIADLFPGGHATNG